VPDYCYQIEHSHHRVALATAHLLVPGQDMLLWQYQALRLQPERRALVLVGWLRPQCLVSQSAEAGSVVALWSASSHLVALLRLVQVMDAHRRSRLPALVLAQAQCCMPQAEATD